MAPTTKNEVIVYDKKTLVELSRLIKDDRTVLYVPKPRPTHRPKHHSHNKQFIRRRPVEKLKGGKDSFSAARKLTDTEEKAHQKKVKSILNKVTLKNIDSLKAELIELITDDSMIEEVVDMMFEKALFEDFFAKVHAHLTIELNEAFGGKKVRGFILNKCHKEFQTGITSGLDDKGKSRMRGNIRFIGELFVGNMIGSIIMKECIEYLIKGDCDEDLEAMCLLMKTIISKFPIENYFDQMTAISKDKKKHSSRIRFMMMDIMDLKK